TYVQRGFLPRWLATFLGVFMALAITFVMLWLAYKPQVRSAATEKLQEAGISTLPPSPSASVPLPQPSIPPQAPTQGAAPSPTEKSAGGGGGGGGSEKKKETKPTEVTAATAVTRLAADDPGVRHICYRAYETGEGWQKPVCDGAMAGTVGQNRPIKSLNLAVSGTKGMNGNEFVHEKEWLNPWTGVADGVDLYLGSTKAEDPYMLAFGVNVTEGGICQNAHVHNQAWLGLQCNTPPKYILGGTFNQSLWLEAVKFTV
ncbi:hydrolase, partial [Streptomyces sp. NPDC002767]